jgi:hypothetical protein
MITRYHTKSGSIYDVKDTVDGILVRRTQLDASRKDLAERRGDRFAADGEGAWRAARGYVEMGVGSALGIFWGTGRDAQSPVDDGLPDELRQRASLTSPITKLETVEET